MKIKFIFLTVFIPFVLLFGQFGKNKVQYEKFKWQYIQSSHFDIYYHDESKELAEYAAVETEKAYISIKQKLNWPLQKRYAIIIYNSHNGFQQTNVVGEYMREGIGGVTELYKNRIVLPFEGSYEDFRHVIHHELVHLVMNDMYFGGNVQSLVSGAVKLNIPAWLAEGSCEFESLEWDVQADMFMRDFTFQSNFIPIPYLNGYYAYKGGQSVFKFVHDTYGSKKLEEFYTNLKSTGKVEKCIKRTFNMDFEKFSESWHKYLKKRYWPEITLAEDVNRNAVRLTDHKELKNYQNIAPAISPEGSKIAFMSDRDGYADIYIMNSSDGSDIVRAVKGNRQANLEEMKWLAPGISWSPDGKNIVFAAKSGQHDALVLVDWKKKKKEFFEIQSLKGIYSAAWHPSKDIIAFEGNDGLHSDIYTYDLLNKTLKNITLDKWRNSNPSWSSDGSHLIYSSERIKDEIKSFKHPYQYDIFSVNIGSKEKTRHTNSSWDENYPIFSNDQKMIFFTSDQNGISNIWRQRKDHKAEALTNILGGIFYPNLSRDGKTLYFSAFQNSGWDIYRINNVSELPGKILNLTSFRKEMMAEKNTITGKEEILLPESNQILTKDSTIQITEIANSDINIIENNDTEDNNYRNYIFIPNFSHNLLPQGTLQDTISIDSTQIMANDGKYFDHSYKTKFSLDLVDSQLGYNTFYGFQGYSVFLFSDVLGDHQIGLSTELYIDLKNSDYAISYSYLKNRINLGINYFNYSDYYYSYMPVKDPATGLTVSYTLAVTQFRNYGSSFAASYPINRFNRIDLNETWYVAERTFLNDPSLNSSLGMLINSLAWVQDNVIWSYTAPMDGNRFRLAFDYVPKVSSDNPSFNTITLDYRKYWKANFDYHFALRFNAGTSWGQTPQTFLLGGIDNWINYQYNPEAPIFGNSVNSFSEDMELYYFSRFITPVRGLRYFEKWGHNFFVINAEFRYPFIEYAKLRFPLPINLFQVRGVIFTDIGSAWNENLDLWDNPGFVPIFNSNYNDLMASTGYGIRIFLGYFLLRFDTAWEYDGHNFSKPRYLFSLGGDF